MHVFITGGAGYIGRAVTRRLTTAGHSVVGLARTTEHESLLHALGAVGIRGDLREPDTYLAAAASADAIVHLAVPSGSDRAAASLMALQSLLQAARAGRTSQFVYTSVLFVLGDTPAGADEDTQPAPTVYAERAVFERQVLAAAGQRLTCAVVRPGMVYGGGEGGAVSELFRTAVAGAARYVGDGENRWSLVHRDDVASLFRHVVEKNGAGVFHATDGAPLRVKEVARRAAAATGGGSAAESMSRDEARQSLGAFADALCLDQPVDAPRSRALGWAPEWPPFEESAESAFAEFQIETAGLCRSSHV